MTFSLTILGSSSALPTSERTVTAHVLNVHERFFLIDCGEGTQMQLRRYRIRFAKIHNIFISHLHGDHFYGLFGLISSLNLMGRKVPLNIYGPPGLDKYLDLHFSASTVQLDYPLVFNSLDMEKAAKVYEDDKLMVESFPLDHKIECCGFIFREKVGERRIKKEAVKELSPGIKDILEIKRGGDFTDRDGKHWKNEELTDPPRSTRSYAYCSDTRYNEAILPFIKNVDLLYHEATYMDEMRQRALKTGHSTAGEAGKIAASADAGILVIGHFSSRYKKLEPLLNEARLQFPDTVLAEDGLEIDIQLTPEG